MKKQIFVAFVVMVALLPILSFGQKITISNVSDGVLIVQPRGGQSLTLASGEDREISCQVNGNKVEFNLKTIKSGSLKALGHFSQELKGGKLILGNDITRKTGASSFEELSSGGSAKTPIVETTTLPQSTVGKILLPLHNGTKHRLSVLDGPFAGAAPACGQNSAGKQFVSPGLLQFSLLYDKDEDSASTGRNYMQAVYSKIITEGDTVVEIKETDLIFNRGKEVKVTLHSQLGFKFYFVSAFDGCALSPGKYWKGKETLNYGPNSFSIQYFQNGLKYQANLEIIITPQDRTIDIRPEDIKNAQIIGYGTKR